jgi:ribosomal protein L32
MSVPKKKLSRTRTRSRRSHDGITAPASMESPIAGDTGFIQPHHSHTFNGKLYTWKELKELMKKK